jgi:hypothetical protein
VLNGFGFGFILKLMSILVRDYYDVPKSFSNNPKKRSSWMGSGLNGFCYFGNLDLGNLVILEIGPFE